MWVRTKAYVGGAVNSFFQGIGTYKHRYKAGQKYYVA